MAVGDAGENVGQISERVDIVELTGFDEGGDGGPMFGAAIRTGEQCVFPVQRDGTDRALDGIVVELNVTIVG